MGCRRASQGSVALGLLLGIAAKRDGHALNPSKPEVSSPKKGAEPLPMMTWTSQSSVSKVLHEVISPVKKQPVRVSPTQRQ